MYTYADFCIGTPVLIILMVFFALAFIGLGRAIRALIRWVNCDDLDYSRYDLGEDD